MKSILLLRHAKSDWDARFDRDHDRPLAQRGVRAAKKVGQFLHRANLVPEAILSSTATRARETVRLAAEAGGFANVSVSHIPSLYGGTPADILQAVATLGNDVESVLVAGHEPGWSQAVAVFCGGGAVRMSTACLARIEFQVGQWSSCRGGQGLLTHLVPARSLT